MIIVSKHIIILKQLITMLIIMCVGVIIKKRNLLTNDGIKGLSVVLSKVAVPFMIINLLQRSYTNELLNEFIFVSISTYLLCVLFTLIFLVISKLFKMNFKDSTLFSISAVYSNVAFMGQPLILALFGESGLIYCVAVIIVQNIYFVTFGVSLLIRNDNKKFSIIEFLKLIFFNDIFISSLIGFFLFFNEIILPESIKNALQYANNSTIFISMIIIGGLLSDANFKKVIKDYKIYIFFILNLIIMPILTKFILEFFIENDIIINVMIILMGTPTAAAMPAFCDRYNADSIKAAEYVFVSTIISFFTLPLIAQLLCK